MSKQQSTKRPAVPAPKTEPQHLVRFDWAMKKLLRSKANVGILEGFLSELLKRKVTIVEFVESESNREHANDKQNRVDVKVRLDGEKNETVLIEIQTSTRSDYHARMLYGVSKAVSESAEKGKTYQTIGKVYSVNILYFDFGLGEDYFYHGTTRFFGCYRSDELQLSPKQKRRLRREEVYGLYPEYFIIKVNQFDDIARTKLDEWIYFMKNEKIEENFTAAGIQEAKEQLDEMNLPEKERIAYRRYVENLEWQEGTDESNYEDGKVDGVFLGREEGEIIGHAKGKAEGIVEGKAEGKAEGEQIGIEKGKAEGKAEERRTMAMQMKKKGIALTDIVEVTGLSVEEVESL